MDPELLDQVEDTTPTVEDDDSVVTVARDPPRSVQDTAIPEAPIADPMADVDVALLDQIEDSEVEDQELRDDEVAFPDNDMRMDELPEVVKGSNVRILVRL